jgi:hypothetical protein
LSHRRGRPPIGAVAMTGAQRQARYRERRRSWMRRIETEAVSASVRIWSTDEIFALGGILD